MLPDLSSIPDCITPWRREGKRIRRPSRRSIFLGISSLATSVAYCLIHQVDLSKKLLEDSRPPTSPLLSASQMECFPLPAGPIGNLWRECCCNVGEMTRFQESTWTTTKAHLISNLLCWLLSTGDINWSQMRKLIQWPDDNVVKYFSQHYIYILQHYSHCVLVETTLILSIKLCQFPWRNQQKGSIK